MFKTKVPSVYLPVAVLAGSVMTILVSGFMARNVHGVKATPVAPSSEKACEMRFMRIDGYDKIRPLLATEQMCESKRYSAVKSGIARLVEEQRAAGVVSEVSVYLRDFRRSEWTAYNGDALYQPGSLMKVPLLMTYLRMAEKDPRVMAKRLVLPMGAPLPFKTHFPPRTSIGRGKPYEVSQLLEALIRRSDNGAMFVLLQDIEFDQLHRTYTDLGLPDFSSDVSTYQISAKNVSTVMKALYNSTYLSIEDSELAISLLLGSEFDQGIKAGLPDGVPLAHKFGEERDASGFQLHETALVYIGDEPYLLTIMTKGPDMKALPQVLASISRYVHEEMVRLRTPAVPS